MCLKLSRTPFVALIIGVYLELSVRNGICDDSQLTARSNFGPNDSQSRHVHNWKGWEDLLSSNTENRRYQHSHHQATMPQSVPLSLKEQERQRSKGTKGDRNGGKGKVKPSQVLSYKNTTKDKTGKEHREEGELTLADLKSLKDTAINLASTVANQFMERWSFLPSSKNELDVDPYNTRNSRAVYLDNLDRPDGPNVGKPEKVAKRGVVDWLSRLIGVQGKTLGEFLREYQVHVLYDLAFTFFKWIFFLYAGLLIP